MGSSGRDPHRGTHLPVVIVLLRAAGRPRLPLPLSSQACATWLPPTHCCHLSPQSLRRQSEGGAHPPAPSQALGELSVSMGFHAGETGGQCPTSCPAPVTSSDPSPTPATPGSIQDRRRELVLFSPGWEDSDLLGRAAQGAVESQLSAGRGAGRWQAWSSRGSSLGRREARGGGGAACTLGAAGTTPRASHDSTRT